MKSLHFLYHELRPEGSPYLYVTPCAAFAAHCALFARVRSQGGEPLRPEITFDDGHASDARYALPTLAEHGLHARFFITAGWTATRGGYMGWSDLKELLAQHTVGAHGMSHKLLTRCNEAELAEELKGAKKRLEDGLGCAVSTMSLPGGRANSRVLEACKEAGYTQVFTSEPKAEKMDAHPFLVGRLNLTSTVTLDWLERVLDPASGVLTKLHRSHQAKAAVKSLLGDTLYARLWALVNRQGDSVDPAGAGAATP